jgi:anthranilate phosphoribosyltransferase
MGVYQSRLVPLVAEAMTMLGTRHAMVVHGVANLDEIALSGPTQIAEVRGGQVRQYDLIPEDVGLTSAPLESLTGGNAALNAAILTAIFAGEPGPRRDVVLLNAAAVLVTSGIASNLTDGIARASLAIDTGATSALVQSLIPNP